MVMHDNIVDWLRGGHFYAAKSSLLLSTVTLGARSTTSTAMAGQPLFIVPLFLGKEQAMPAGLLLILLLRAGIERNPRLTPAGKTRTKIKWAYSVCCQNIPKTKCSVQCNKCTKWVHLSCSGLSISAQWSTTFTGPCCTRSPSAPLSRTPISTPLALLFTILQINICGLWGRSTPSWTTWPNTASPSLPCRRLTSGPTPP